MPRSSGGGGGDWLEMTGILTLYNPKRSKASNYKMYRCTIEPSKEMKQAHYTILMSSHFVLILNTHKKKTFKLAKLSPFHHFLLAISTIFQHWLQNPAENLEAKDTVCT